jgi:hypothetical protein
MTTDQQIADCLAPLDLAKMPIEGEWRKAPYPHRTVGGRELAVLLDDPGLQALVVDRSTGEVLQVEVESTEFDLVNRTLAQFGESAAIYLDAHWDAESIDEDDDAALAENGEQALAAIRAVDPDAVRYGYLFWAVATENLRYGV